MDTPVWQILVDAAQIVAGIAAAYALVQVVRFRKLDNSERERDRAEQVSAWAVSEGEIVARDDFQGGVVIRNDTPHTITDIEVKTQRRDSGSLSSLSDDGSAGQHFNLIPHGVYYLQQYVRRDGSIAWSAPKPVDTASGRVLVELPPDDTGRPPVVTLVPVSIMPEPKVVSYLSFELAGQRWERWADGELRRVGARKPKNDDVRLKQLELWKKEFEASKVLELQQPKQRQVHDVNERVQEIFTQLAQYLAAGSPSPEQLIAEPLEVDEGFVDVFTTVRLSRRKQNVTLGLPGGETTIYFAGSGKGEIPSGVEHTGLKSCALKTAKFRELLKPAAGSGAELAEALVAQLRQRGAQGDGLCTCGTPFTFA